MLIKITGCILIISCGIFAGMYYAKKAADKTKFISEYISFLTQAKTMICFSCTEIKEILTKVHSVPLMENMISDTLKNMNNGKAFSDAWKCAVISAEKRKEFDSSDLPLLLSFSEGFGELGAEEETEKIELYLASAALRFDELQKDTFVKQRLYRTVGTFCGILAAVVLV